MKTLGRLQGIPAKQTFYPQQLWPARNSFGSMARFHSDIREITAEQASEFKDSARIFKQHTPPTENNLAQLGDTKIVLLTREPSEIVLAYRRWEATGDSPQRIEFKGLETEEQWLNRARDLGLLDELERFRATWSALPNVLAVDFRDLIKNPDETIDRIEDHFGLARSARPVELDRERYTRSDKPAGKPAAKSPSQKKKKSLAARIARRLRGDKK